MAPFFSVDAIDDRGAVWITEKGDSSKPRKKSDLNKKLPLTELATPKFWVLATGSETFSPSECFNAIIREAKCHPIKKLPKVEKPKREVAQTSSHQNDEAMPARYSEDSIALAFSGDYAEDYRYVAIWGRWMHYDGVRWAHDSTLKVYDLARKVCRSAAAAASNDPTLTDAQREKIPSVFGRSSTVAAIEKLAKADRRHAATVAQWDADHWLLNTNSGVVDLRTGEVFPGWRDAYMTKCCNAKVSFEPPVEWLKFLDTATGGDAELQTFLKRLCGYTLTGLTREQILVFIYGPGGNGKGTFLNTLQWVMGDYATSADMETFTEKKHDAHLTELACLMGARMVTAQETEQGKKWAEARIKKMTGGDPIKANFMRQDLFEYIPQFQLIIAGNHKPALRSVDAAIRRRMRIIPFDVVIPPEKKDVHLSEKLRAEADRILGWCIQGCLDWQEDGLQPPEKVLAATDEYLDGQDTIGLWMTDCCEKSTTVSGEKTELFQSYQKWCGENGEYAKPKKNWLTDLESRGCHQPPTHHTAVIVGICLKNGTQ